MRSDELERAVLSKILEEGDLLPVLRMRITSQAFQSDNNRAAFDWVTTHFETHGRVPSYKLLRSQFPGWKAVEIDDGLEQVTSQLRSQRLYGGLQQLTKNLAAEAEDDPNVALKVLIEEGSRLGFQYAEGQGEDVSRTGMEVWKAYRRNKKKLITGVRWMWEPLNRCTRGMRWGTMSMLYGPPGIMKTWLLMAQAVFAYVEQEIKPLLITTEMPVDEMRERYYMMLAGLDADAFEEGELTKEEEKRFKKICREKRDLPFYIESVESTGHLALAELTAKMKAYGTRALKIDGFRGLCASGRHEDMGDFAVGLKRLARVNKYAVLATHHANRDRKKLSSTDNDAMDVAGSEDIFRQCDNLLRLDRTPEHEEAEEIEIIVRKARRAKGRVAFVINAKPAWDFSYKRESDAFETEGDGDEEEI